MAEPPVQVPALNRAMLAVVVAVLGFLGFLTVGIGVQLFSVPFGLWFSEIFVFFAIPFVLLRLSGRAVLPTIGLGRPWAAGLALGFALGVANFFAAAMPLMWLGQQLAPHEWLELFDSTVIFKDKSTLELVTILSAVSIAAPVCEETFFRGVLQPGAMSVLSPVRAVVLTAFWFSFCHLDPIGFFARWELGIVFGLLAWRTGSLWPSIAAHLANNLTSSVLFLATRDIADDATASEAAQLLTVAGVGGLLLVGTLWLARAWPSALRAPRPAAETLQPAPSPLKAVGPWLLAAAVSFGAFIVVNPRGAAVNAIDMATTIRPPKKDAPDEERAQWEHLRTMRRQALEGELPLRDYFEERRARLAEKHGTLHQSR